MGLGKKGRHYGVVERAVVSETTGFKLIPFSSYVTFYKQVRVNCHICKMGMFIPWVVVKAFHVMQINEAH